MRSLEPGVWGVLPTPFDAQTLALDEGSLDAALDLFKKADVTGVVALGVFGEAARLTPAERAHVVTRASEVIGAHRVVVGLTALDTAAALDEAGAAVGAARAPLAALMVQINSTSPETVVDHLYAIHRHSELPVVLQDYPIASGVQVSSEDIVEMLRRCDCIAAVKCENPPTSLAIAELAAHTQVPLFGGLGGLGLLDELQAGAAGAMTGFSYPEVLVKVVAAWRDGGYPAARAVIAPWLPLINYEAQVKVGLSIRKENLRRRGVLSSAAVRPPALPFPDSLTALTDAHFRAVQGLGR
ncbi:MAG TPA: dihydrodipicolinate synthase family protein [Jatrophihabitans sp.]|nr:dihydrodipicolinate synthase family protein [Jatrophihabitans sp.]